jgi:hypothetical protein
MASTIVRNRDEMSVAIKAAANAIVVGIRSLSIGASNDVRASPADPKTLTSIFVWKLRDRHSAASLALALLG